MATPSTVCVTGAAGYVGSWLVQKLLQRGYIVHATLRSLADESKVQMLKKLEGADERLRLFEADLYDAEIFEKTINGCDFVFLVATPLFHQPSSKYKDTTEASLAALQIIMGACERSESVKRVIYTASVLSAAPRNEDDFSFKNSMDESCWTPLHYPSTHDSKFMQDYIRSKTLTEKEFLSHNTKRENRGLQVVSIDCALVCGNGILPNMPGSLSAIISPLSKQTIFYRQLKLLQELLSSVPLAHIDDVCEAHIFCIENEHISGRVMCVSHTPVMQEIIDYYKLKFPEARVLDEVEDESGRNYTPLNCSKLLDLGFKYKYNLKQILDGSVDYAKRVGGLPDL